ncbi:hypothetical protein ABZ470_02925 [Streptosporangium sp. NPDC020072]|uniref:hypothetical protein n=1 Tax=Streptosporangium sp. NPDC020072 TaxID=3154788 RepID=UPI003444A42B
MREPRWGTPRPTAVTAVGLLLVLLLAAVSPSPWSGGWRPADAGTGFWVPGTDTAGHSTAPRLLAGGTEHLPTPGQLRSLLAVGATVATPGPPPSTWRPTGPAAAPRHDVQRAVTSRSPPAA